MMFGISHGCNSIVRHTVSFCKYRKFSTHLYVKGFGIYGALGLSEDLRDAKSFVKLILNEDEPDDKVTAVSAGYGHSAVVTESGKLYMWGRPYDFGSLNRFFYRLTPIFARFYWKNSEFFLPKDENMKFHRLPVLLHDQNNKIVDVKCSAGLTVFLSDKGKIYAFGENRFSQCGIHTALLKKGLPDDVINPIEITIPLSVKIDVGLQHGIALTKEGEVYTWGKTDRGRLGLNINDFQQEPKSLPCQVMLPHPRNGCNISAIDISAGFAHSTAIAKDGSFYVWGRGMSVTEKQQKIEKKKSFLRKITEDTVYEYEDQLLPRRIDLPGNRKAVKIFSR
jgi:alpha-tubulin suppressor-like RCC1 family protein